MVLAFDQRLRRATPAQAQTKNAQTVALGRSLTGCQLAMAGAFGPPRSLLHGPYVAQKRRLKVRS